LGNWLANKLANSDGKQGKTGVKPSQQWEKLNSAASHAHTNPTEMPRRYKRSPNPGKKLVSLRPAL